jgi:hypothetical protein
VKRVLIAAAFASALALSGPVSAEPGSCISDRGCANSGTGGSGSNYRFAVDDPDLSNNFYIESPFNSGPVNDNVNSVRNRRSSVMWFCTYQDFNYIGGKYGQAAFAGGFVATTNKNSSSARFRSAAQGC